MLTIDLSGKIVLLTGGSRGIGAAICELLCRAGATVIFTHTGNPQRGKNLAELLERIKRAGGNTRAEILDACNAGETVKLAGRIAAEFGKIDLLVANVGQNLARPVEKISVEEWKRFIDINLNAAFYAVRAVIPHMIKAGYGRIVLIGSSAVYNGGGGAIDYASAKAGLNGMMMYLAKEYARKGILTNTIHPAVINTELLRERYDTEGKKAALRSQIPAGRLGKPNDIAAMTAFLASSWGDYICGQSILIDGGRTFFR